MPDHAAENIRYQEDARQQVQFLNSLIDSQTNFLIRFDIKGRFTFVNNQFLKIFGYKKAGIIGKHFSLTVLPEDMPLCEKAFVNCVSRPGKVINLAHKKKDTKGHLHDTEWEFISISNEQGVVTGIQGVGQDVTQKKTGRK